MDNPTATLAMTILNDAMIFRSQLNNLIERNAEFKTIIGGSVAEYLIFIQEFANKQT